MWLAHDATDGHHVAVKIIKAPEFHAAGQYEYFISKPLEHPHIVRTYSCSKTPSNELLIIQEFCAGGDLFARVEPDVGMPVAAARQFMHELLLGVGYLHQNGIVHRDLKPENVLIDQRGVAKLCDFGMAEHQGVFVPQGNGTLPYVAPEVLLNKGGYTVSFSQDLWSCGIILYIMLAGDFPWLEASLKDPEYKAFAAGSRSLGAWPTFSSALLALFDRLLATDPTQRGTVAAALPLLGHVWRPRQEAPEALAGYRRRNALPLPRLGSPPNIAALSLSGSESSSSSS